MCGDADDLVEILRDWIIDHVSFEMTYNVPRIKRSHVLHRYILVFKVFNAFGNMPCRHVQPHASCLHLFAVIATSFRNICQLVNLFKDTDSALYKLIVFHSR